MAKLKLSDTWKPFRGPNQMYSITSCRFGVKLVEMGRKPHRSKRVWLRICKNPGWPPTVLMDRRIFKKYTAIWKAQAGYRLDEESNIVPVTFLRQDWIDFATGLDYYITPTQTTTITGFKAFIAWQQAALSSQGLRWNAPLMFPYYYPFVQWPDPPATYDPWLLTEVDAEQQTPSRAIYYWPTPDPWNTEHSVVLYITRPAFKGQLETERTPIVINGYKVYFPGEPGEPYTDNSNWLSRWSCYGPGWITASMQIVDWATGSPSPIVGKRIHVV